MLTLLYAVGNEVYNSAFAHHDKYVLYSSVYMFPFLLSLYCLYLIGVAFTNPLPLLLCQFGMITQSGYSIRLKINRTHD